MFLKKLYALHVRNAQIGDSINSFDKYSNFNVQIKTRIQILIVRISGGRKIGLISEWKQILTIVQLYGIL